MNIEDFKIPLERGGDRLKPDGLHTGPENWNKQWRDFFDEHDEPSRKQILDKLVKMRKTFGLE